MTAEEAQFYIAQIQFRAEMVRLAIAADRYGTFTDLTAQVADLIDVAQFTPPGAP